MKTKTLSILFICTFLLAFVTCKKELDPNIETFEITKERATEGTTTWTIDGTYDYPGVIDGIKACVSGDGVDMEFEAVLDGKEFSVTMTGLKPATEYQYHYAVDYGFSKPFLTETKTFTTLSSESPTVKALEILKIDSTTYRIKCQVIADGGTEVTERGICWNTFGAPTLDDSFRRYEGNMDIFDEYSVYMENLALGKKYYVRAYAKNEVGKTGLSEEVLDFETEASAGMTVDIELSCNPEAGGTVSGGGSYEVGTQCTATAEANAGYTFINWTENDIQVSSEASYTFAVTTGRSLVANFTKQACVITVQVDPEGSGTVTGAGGYDYGEECNLTATAKTGYDFVKWTKDGASVTTSAEYTFTVTESAIYVAHFKLKSYTIEVLANPTNGGTVTGGGTFNYGESCRVQADPADGFAFANWTDDGDVVSEEANYTFTVTSNRTLVANFTVLQANEYSITVSANPSEGGTVTGGGVYQEGVSCKVTATAESGFTFVNWTENDVQVSDLAEYRFTVTSNRNLVANFEALAPTEYNVSVSANPSNGGTVTGGGTYEQGEQCTVSAEANTGYTFTNWTEDGNVVSTQANYTFTVNRARTLVANFQVQSYTISASASPTNGGTVTGGGTYDYGQNCPLSATASSGYTFTNWTENGNVVSTNANYSFTVTGNRTLVANFTVQAPNTYTINVSANPGAGGTVTGGGSYNQGASCTVTATANTGYTFLRWTENGSQVSTNANYTFTVTGNRTLVAQFQVQSYTITASANPTNGGNVTGGGSYDYGQSCTLTATSAMGYTFLRWTENGNQVSTNPNYTFTVTGNRTLVAQFQVQSYTITASANPTNGGSVSGGGNYDYGQSCTLTATAASGYTFIRWTENGNQVSTNANYTFTVTSNRTLVAQFQAQSYTISVSASPTNGGSVLGGGTYTYGQSCTVSATAATGYTFTNWTEGGNVVSTNANYTFTVTGNRTLVANFTAQSYTISVSANPSNGGTVSGGGSYNYGQSCTVSATAAADYTFTNWTEGGNVVSTNANYTFTVTGNRTLVANFEVQAPNTYTINVSANPGAGGTVTGGGSYNQGASCTVTATANTGYTFLRWTENGNQVSTNANYTFTVTGNRTLVAQFQVQSYTITASANPTNGGSVSGGGSYDYGQSCTLTATAASGYTFIRWTENGNQVSTSANYTFTVTGNRTLVAQFQAQSYTISVSANPTNGGSVSGGGTYTYGQSCTVSATAAAGYTFTNWTEGGNVVSTNANYTFTVTGNRTLVANFTAQSYTISVSANPSNGGTVSGGGSYNYGQSCTVTATANTGYTFLRWTENGSQVSTNANYTFTVTGDRTLVAQFQAQTYTISVSANPTNGGTVTGGGTYNHGASCTVTATANSNYTFTNWTENGSVVSTNASYQFTVTGNRTLVANFTYVPPTYTVSVSANPTNGGTVTGGGTYNHGASCTVTATAANNYTFANWTENGSVVSTNSNYTFTVTGNRNLVAIFTAQSQAPTGAINGLFSISANQQVYFSQGNLQYIGGSQPWKFADNQWDMIGTSQGNTSQTTTRDLFGWGTSGWSGSGATYYRPWDTDNSDGSLYGPPGLSNLTGTYANADWGVYNAINNGGNTTGQWRTITSDEWVYLFQGRSGASLKYGHGEVNGVNGMILLPDSWTLPSGLSFIAGNSSWANVYTTEQWALMEQNGAVFLPAAGTRSGTSFNNVGSGGRYWSAYCSPSTNGGAYSVSFGDSYHNAHSNSVRCAGFSVRLVRLAQ